MIVLKSTDTLQVVLAGAITTSQGVLCAAFVDMASDASTYGPGNSTGTTNSTTAVSWVASPSASNIRQVKWLSLYNADTAAMTVTVRINDGTNNRTVLKVTLQPNERIEYNDAAGFQVVSSAGVSGGFTNPMTTTGDIITGGSAGAAQRLAIGSTGQRLVVSSGAPAWADDPDAWCIAVSDETTAITTGTAKVTWYAPYACTILEVFIGLTTQSSSGVVTADVNKNGTSIFSTNPSIDASEDTSLTGTAAVLSTTALAKGDKLTADIDAAGTGAKGLKVYMRVRV